MSDNCFKPCKIFSKVYSTLALTDAILMCTMQNGRPLAFNVLLFPNYLSVEPAIHHISKKINIVFSNKYFKTANSTLFMLVPKLQHNDFSINKKAVSALHSEMYRCKTDRYSSISIRSNTV